MLGHVNFHIQDLLKLINKKGTYNLGGKSQTIYNFAKFYNNKVKKIFSKGDFPLRQDMNLEKTNKVFKFY